MIKLRLAVLFLSVLCAGSLLAQSNNIGTPIPASAFGCTIFDSTITSPLLSCNTVRSWDGNHLAWGYLNPSSGTYMWTNMDAWYAAHNGQQDMVYTFGLTPSWAASDPTKSTQYPPYYPATYSSSCTLPGASAGDLTAWHAFVLAMVTRYPNIKYWEMWNEPLNGVYWCAGTTGTTFDTQTKMFTQMALMLADAYTTVHAAIPGAVVLAPSTYQAYGITWLNSLMSNAGTAFSAIGRRVPWDQLAFHGYTGNGTTAEALPAMIAGIGTFNASNGGAIPLVDTEVTEGSADAPYVAKMLLLSWSAGVSRSIFYGYDHLGSPALWSPTNGLSDAGTGYTTMYNWLVGATLTAACSVDGSGTWTCPISRTSYTGEIVWNSTTTVSVSAPGGMAQFRDIEGGIHSVVGGVVSVGNSPILIETPSTTKAIFVNVGGQPLVLTQ